MTLVVDHKSPCKLHLLASNEGGGTPGVRRGSLLPRSGRAGVAELKVDGVWGNQNAHTLRCCVQAISTVGVSFVGCATAGRLEGRRAAALHGDGDRGGDRHERHAPAGDEEDRRHRRGVVVVVSSIRVVGSVVGASVVVGTGPGDGTGVGVGALL